MRQLKKRFLGGAALIAGATQTAHAAASEGTSLLAAIDPLVAGAAGAVALSLASVIWAIRVSASSKSQTITWSRRLAEMEAAVEKSDAVLSAHPGLVLVWEDDNGAIDDTWGEPKILGGPAALASLLSFSQGAPGDQTTPVDRLLETLADMPVDGVHTGDGGITFREKVRDLRAHGVAFSGSVMTSNGRAIEADGRVAGGQVALWITDPAVKTAEDGAIIGAIRESTTDLHGSHVLLDRAPFPAWRRDENLNLIWVNKTFVETVEAKNQQEVLKQQIELDPSARKTAEAASNTQKITDARLVVNANGERQVLRITEIPMHAAGEASLGGFATDVSELDRARADLQQHINANRSTLDQIPAAVALFGPGQNLAYYNRAFAQLWSLEDAALNGRVFHGEILDQLRHKGILPEQENYDAWKAGQLALYTESLSEPGSERHGGAPDEIWNLPDGRTLRAARQRHPLGGVIAVFEDITEKMSLEARFNTQLKVQRATLNNLSEGVAVFGADGALKLFNASFEKLWRLDKKLLANTPHMDEFAAAVSQRIEDAPTHVGRLKKCVTSKSSADRQAIADGVMSLRDGRTFAYGSEPLPDGATLIHFLDVTDSMEREKELQERNDILEDADRMKSKFIDHVSYQLRTPLSTIIGFTEMLDGQMFGVLNDRQQDYVASVLSASYHLRDLINDVIDLAAIDAGKLELQRADVDIRKLLENAATYAALKAEDTQVALKVDCKKDIGTASLDERRMKQILFNLLSNAFAYSSAGGTVTLGADREGPMVRFWVRDTGRGISPEDQAKAFDAFESRGPSAGAGLGLALVQRFIKLHGGWVKLKSAVGEGSHVICYIPEGAALIDDDDATTEADLTARLAAASKTSSPAPKKTARKQVKKTAAAPKQKRASRARPAGAAKTPAAQRPRAAE